MEDYRITYLKMLSEVGVDEGLVEWLENHGFFTSPATTKFHHSYQGGLCQHSIEVAETSIKLKNSLIQNESISDSSLIKLGLLHDISKSSCFELTSVNKKIYSADGNKYDELGNFYWESQLGYKYKDDIVLPGNYGFSSYMIAKPFISFTDDEIIALSNYQYILNPNDSVNSLRLMGTNKLMTLLSISDISSSYLTI